MRILFVLENYWPHIGGVEVVFKQLAEGLAQQGHHVTVLTQHLKGTKDSEKAQGVQIIRLRTFNRYGFTFLAIPKTISLARKADIIHTTTYNGAFPARIASILAKKPALITIHEVLGKKWEKFEGMSKASAKLHRLLERLVISLDFKRFVCVSHATEQDAITAGIKKEKVSVVYNGVDYNQFSPMKEEGARLRRLLGVDKKFVCLFFGRPGISKGLEFLLKAMPQIKKRIPEAKLVALVSKAKAYRKQYKRMINIIGDLELEHDIIVLEPVKREALPAYIQAADCVVVPSLAEGFGFTAAESCAMGVPVVASNTASLPEVVSGKYVLVKPASPEAIAAGVVMVHAKKYTVSPLKKFTMKENIEGYLKVYKQLIKKE